MATHPAPSPLGLAIVICDQIIEDKQTRKKSLIGIFNQIGTNNFPCRHPRMSVYVSLTEGRGQYAVRLRIAQEDSGQTVGEVQGQIQFGDIHAVAELKFDLLNVNFPSPGLYAIEFYCDDMLILERRFQVLQIKPAQGPPAAEL